MGDEGSEVPLMVEIDSRSLLGLRESLWGLRRNFSVIFYVKLCCVTPGGFEIVGDKLGGV